MWIHKDDLASGVVIVQEKEGFCFLVDPKWQGYQMEGVVDQKARAFIQTINVGTPHMFKHGQTLGMFGDGASEDILVH